LLDTLELLSQDEFLEAYENNAEEIEQINFEPDLMIAFIWWKNGLRTRTYISKIKPSKSKGKVVGTNIYIGKNYIFVPIVL